MAGRLLAPKKSSLPDPSRGTWPRSRYTCGVGNVPPGLRGSSFISLAKPGAAVAGAHGAGLPPAHKQGHLPPRRSH